MTPILDEIRNCYKSVFVGSIRSVGTRKATQKMMSLRSSRMSETGWWFLFLSQVIFYFKYYFKLLNIYGLKFKKLSEIMN